MDEKQARAAVQNLFHNRRVADEAIAAVDPALAQVLDTVADLLRRLPPPGDLLREQAWARLRPELVAALEGYSTRLGDSIVRTLVGEMDEQVRFARSFLGLPQPAAPEGGAPITGLTGPEIARVTPAEIGGINVPLPEGDDLPRSWATGQFVTFPRIGVTVPRWVFERVRRTRIGETELRRLFPNSVEVPEGGRLRDATVGRRETGYTQFMVKSVDSRVRTGLLRGDTNEQMARDLVEDSARRGLNLGPTARSVRSSGTAVARSAVQDLAQRIHEEFWEANNTAGPEGEDKIIQAWEFDATLDSRTCPTCMPLDGLLKPNKEDIPQPPLHPACRCRRLPVTSTELLRRAERTPDEQIATSVELVDIDNVPPRRKGEKEKAYKDRLGELGYFRSKGRAGGELWTRRVVRHKAVKQAVPVSTLPREVREILIEDGRLKPGQKRIQLTRSKTAVEWLASPTTTQASLQVSFGGGRAGAVRALLFKRWLKQGVAPQDAFNRLVTGKTTSRRWIPVRKLDFDPDETVRVARPNKRPGSGRGRRPPARREDPAWWAAQVGAGR